jgi:aquaporin Z
MTMWQKYAAEVYGTFVLVGIGTGAILGASFLNGLGVASGIGQSESFIITVAFAFGLALIVGLYSVGRISGGHFNPAISLAAYLDKRISLAQSSGGR